MKWLKNLTVQVIVAIILGIAVGAIWPEFGASLKILADMFIKLIKMLIGPIIFLTVVIGIGGMGDMKKLGKIGGKVYFTSKSYQRLPLQLVLGLPYLLTLVRVSILLRQVMRIFRNIRQLLMKVQSQVLWTSSTESSQKTSLAH